MMIVPRESVPVPQRRPSDVWLEKQEAEALVSVGASKARRAPSYEKQFKKGFARGYFVHPCDCSLRSSLELGRVELVTP